MSKISSIRQFPVMENMSLNGVAAYLEQKSSVIIPLGVIEQHGHHLPLSTDALIATHLGRLIGRQTDTLVAPTMYQSFSGGNCPGTINISPATMSLVVSDMLTSLVTQGFRNFYLLLCHGGSENDRALDNALKLLLRSNTMFDDVMIALMPVWKLSSSGIGWQQAVLDGDWHAGWLETSMVMHFAPDLVDMGSVTTDDPEVLEQMKKHPDNYQMAEKIVDDDFVVARQRQRPEVKVGVMGMPDQASRETGRLVVEDIVANAVAKITELEAKADGVYRKISFEPEPLILN